MPADRTGRAMPISADPIRIIADSPLMRSVDRSSLEGLGAELDWVVLDENEALVLDGNRGDALYFVASGRLEIGQPPEKAGGAAGNGSQSLAAVVTGDVIGEMRALRTTEPTTIRAVAGTHLVKLEKSRLEQYLATRPDLGGKLGNVFIPLPDYASSSAGLRHDGPSVSCKRGLPARDKLAKATLRAPSAGTDARDPRITATLASPPDRAESCA